MTDKKHTADISDAREFRIVQHRNDPHYVLEWMTMDGTIMTVTAIKLSREGLLETMAVLSQLEGKV